MLKAFPISAMDGAAQEALGNAIERVIAALGIGTAVAFLLGILVYGVEVLARRHREKGRKPPGPSSPRTRRREVYR